jgi:hypothetical protein
MRVEPALMLVESTRSMVRLKCVDLILMRMIVFQTAAGMCLRLGLCIYCNKVF